MKSTGRRPPISGASTVVRRGPKFRSTRSALRHQANALDRHEKKIADHTGIQSWTAILSLIFGVITTAALILITYQQYKIADRQASISERQVELEYAKIAPQFSVNVEPSAGVSADEYESRLPYGLSIKMDSGQAGRVSVRVFQDIRVAVIEDGRSEHLNCTIRTDNYFNAKLGSLNVMPHAKVASIVRDQSALYGRNDTQFMSLSRGPTWVEISFSDIFSKRRRILYGGSNGELSVVPNGEMESDELFEVAPGSFASGARADFPALWLKAPQGSVESAECAHILEKLQR